MFYRDSVVHAMGEFGALSFYPMKFSFEPKRFSSLGITLIRNLFNRIEKHILFCPETNIISIRKMSGYWTIFISIDISIDLIYD